MADRDDSMMEGLGHGISRVYTLLVTVCQALPVPIAIPAEHHVSGDEAVIAVRRVADLAPDQPMGDLQEAQLYTGCLYILAAIDLYGLCSMRYVDIRAEATGAQILNAQEALHELLHWLRDQN